MSVDVVVIGAGIVGAACAYFAAAEGLSVCIVDSGAIAGGTTSAGEGNLLVSDKQPGPELELATMSNELWQVLADMPFEETSVAALIEMEAKGSLVVASTDDAMRALEELSQEQRVANVESVPVDSRQLRSYEPNIASDLAGGLFYPQDMQIQPMRATAMLLRMARRHGAQVHSGERVTGLLQRGGRIVGVQTAARRRFSGAVVNAAGAWAGEIARLASVNLPISPRRGFVLVTEPLPQVVHHKVYFSDYVSDVASDSPVLQASAVVEGTASGPILIGATRERVSFDRTLSPYALRSLAAGATRLFPFLADVAAIRAYRGFRPYCPDHLPVIGPDSRAPGLWHACGHEGAGIGLSAATGRLIAESLQGLPASLPLRPFRPERFEGPHE